MGIIQKQFLYGETAFSFGDGVILKILHELNSFIWGLPALVMILGVGVFLTLHTRAAQLRLLPAALVACFRPFFSTENGSDRSKRRALCTALAATVGTGNLAGVAGAIALGGPGAVFWIWVCGLLGMVTKMAEASLSIRYRITGKSGDFNAGPMYMILETMKKKWHWLAYVYCFFGVVASFGVGNATQINAVVGGIHSSLQGLGIEKCIWLSCGIGILLGLLVWKVLSGGVSRIGAVAEKLVPIAAAFYVLLCIVALWHRKDKVFDALYSIVYGAFHPQALTGGIVGSFFVCLRVGAARGVFTNEAGMGTAAMAHGTAKVTEPLEQGMMGIIEVFVDTILICTLTALVILTSGIKITYGMDLGIGLTTQAFVSVFGQWVSVFLSVALCLFAIATIFGWGLYGIQCFSFLFGYDQLKRFVFLQACMAVIASIMQTQTLWLMAEIVNGLMAIPNLIILAKLAPEFVIMLQSYERKKAGNKHWNS